MHHSRTNGLEHRCGHRAPGGGRRNRRDTHLVAESEPLHRLGARPVDPNLAGPDQSVDQAARSAELTEQEVVQSLAGAVGIDLDGANAGPGRIHVVHGPMREQLPKMRITPIIVRLVDIRWPVLARLHRPGHRSALTVRKRPCRTRQSCRDEQRTASTAGF